MPRDRRARPTAIMSTGTTLRIGSLIVMLLIMGMTINRFRPRGVILPAAPVEAPAEGDAAPQPVIAIKPAAPGNNPAVEANPPAAVGPVPIEHDEEDKAMFAHDAEAIADRSLTILPVEQRAYWRLIRWVKSEPLSALIAARPPEVNYQNFVLRPEKHRAELVQMELLVRRALKYEAPAGNSAGVKTLYELWGWPANAHGRMYTVVTPELPAGFPIGAEIHETARVYGYFFKLQAYELGSAKPYAAPQVSPLLVGRVQWTPFVSPNATIDPLTYVGLAVGIPVLMIVIGCWIWTGRRKPAVLATRNATLAATTEGESYQRHDSDEDDWDDSEPAEDPFRWVKEEDGHAAE